jgi:AcrR family transcriptional regulator
MAKSQKYVKVTPMTSVTYPRKTHSSHASRRERKAAETRLKLFRSALELFSQRGFPNVTIEDITEAADVGKGTFFNYFESKDHVLGVMAEIQLGKVAEARKMAAEAHRNIRDVLHHLILRAAEEPGRSPDLARALISSFLASGAVRAIVRNGMATGRQMLAEILAAGQQSGEIDPTLNAGETATQFLQMFLGTVLFWSLHEKPALRVWVEDSFRNFWRGVAASAPQPGRE